MTTETDRGTWKYYKHTNADIIYMLSQLYKVDFWSINYIDRKTRKVYLLNGKVKDIPESIDVT